MPIYEIALHGSNLALNYKEEKHFVKIFANESGISKKHFSIVEVISWILIVSDWILTWICVIWAITLELYNNHVFFKEAWIILESLLNCCRTPHCGGSVCGADDRGQPVLCGCVWPGHDQSGSLQAGRDRRNSFIWQ